MCSLDLNVDQKAENKRGIPGFRAKVNFNSQGLFRIRKNIFMNFFEYIYKKGKNVSESLQH